MVFAEKALEAGGKHTECSNAEAMGQRVGGRHPQIPSSVFGIDCGKGEQCQARTLLEGLAGVTKNLFQMDSAQ